ncbi:MAG: right-handed parallel beta-helix repeat-containing protein [Candidatus Omnitrophica bacterium]|nr:right-handed parallel beta-helix repeat-containing protein [Candidatus Omnitrophota bacterium]
MTFYVSKKGNDNWSGRLSKPNLARTDGPFQTLQKALNDAKKAEQFPVKIEIMEGVYPAFDTVRIEFCNQITVRGNSAIFTGGKKIEAWEKVKDKTILERLDEKIRDKLWKTNLKKQGISDSGDFSQPSWAVSSGSQMQLYFNGKPMQIARWPDTGFAYTGDILGNGMFTCDAEKERIEKWKKEKFLKAYGYWFYEWAAQHMEIDSVDPEQKSISIRNPDLHSYGYKKGAMYFIYDALSEITQPGEWYLDRETEDLYFYPPSDIENGEAIVSISIQPMIEIKGSSNIKIENISFENSRKEAIVVNDSSDVVIDNCVFRNLGSWAIKAEGVKNTKVQNCHIYNMAEGGILIEGGDRKTLASGNNQIINNHIHDFSIWMRVYRPAIQIGGVGNRVANNLIHDAPHSAILWSGNENIIEFNEIYNVVLETNDAGAVYSGRDPSMQGNIIRYNYFYDIGKITGHGVASVYLDDGHCGNTVYGNIFYRACKPGSGNFGAVFIHGGRYNTIENNIFIECQQAYNESPWDQKRWNEFWTNPPYNRRLFGDIDVRKEPYLSKYPHLTDILQDTRPNVLARNIVYKCARFTDRGKPQLIDNLVGVDPMFETFQLPVVKLHKDSPAFKMGFKQIPAEKIGLILSEKKR